MDKEAKQQIIQHSAYGAEIKNTQNGFTTCIPDEYHNEDMFDNGVYKLQLRPLSESNKIDALLDFDEFFFSFKTKEWMFDGEFSIQDINKVITILLENHFDLDGLIEKGYAEPLPSI